MTTRAILATGLAAIVLHAASFEVASVKSSPPDAVGSGSDWDGGFVRMHNFTLRRIVAKAWGLPDDRIIAGPKWLDQNRFDIEARSASPATNIQERDMLRSLLADRFHFTAHLETRLIPGYALATTKNGIRAQRSAPDTRSHDNGSRGHMEAAALTMRQLASRLAGILGVPVTDATNNTEAFDFTLQWNPEDPLVQTNVLPDSPDIMTALQTLGLKLEARKSSADFLIVDDAQLPPEN